ncbi:MAG: hypothetical protein LAT67_05910 [Balneolales bacterium]|nr:hypothetical protein [Balneolales bacterium]
MNYTPAIFSYKHWKVIICLTIIVFYALLWRPFRAQMTSTAVYPLIASITESEPDTFRISTQNKSVIITVFEYTLKENWEAVHRQNIINEVEDNPSSPIYRSPYLVREHIFGMPFGFYMFFPILFLIWLTRFKPYVIVHISVQFAGGFICILLFLYGLSFISYFMHFYRFLTYYFLPGMSFIIIFIGFFNHKLNRLSS